MSGEELQPTVAHSLPPTHNPQTAKDMLSKASVRPGRSSSATAARGLRLRRSYAAPPLPPPPPPTSPLPPPPPSSAAAPAGPEPPSPLGPPSHAASTSRLPPSLGLRSEPPERELPAPAVTPAALASRLTSVFDIERSNTVTSSPWTPPKTAVISKIPLPPSSFERLLSLSQAHLKDERMSRPDPHAEHSRVGRQFVGEIRDSEGAVVDGSKLTSLALRLGVLGVLKKELGYVEQISFLPEQEPQGKELEIRDRFSLLLTAPPAAAAQPLRSHPLSQSFLYLPLQKGYAFSFELPVWATEEGKTVGGPSLEDVVRLGRGGEEEWNMPLSGLRLGMADLVERERQRDGSSSLVDNTSSVSNTPSDPSTLTDAKSSSPHSYTILLTQVHKDAIRPTHSYPPTLTFGHPYPPITNLTYIRDFDTRLWSGLRVFDGFNGGLAKARKALAARLGLEVGSVREEKERILRASKESVPDGKSDRMTRVALPHKDELAYPSSLARLQASRPRAVPKPPAPPPSPPSALSPVADLPSSATPPQDTLRGVNESSFDLAPPQTPPPTDPVEDDLSTSEQRALDEHLNALYDEPPKRLPNLSVRSLSDETHPDHIASYPDGKPVDAPTEEAKGAKEEEGGWLSKLFGGGEKK